MLANNADANALYRALGTAQIHYDRLEVGIIRQQG